MTGKTQDNRAIYELSVSSLATWKALVALSTIDNSSSFSVSKGVDEK